jgi:uncharacterized oligopeptide transporter (OPT) family protein
LFRNLQSIEKDLERTLQKLRSEQVSGKKWEEETKLQLKQTKSVFSSYLNELESLSKTFTRKSEQYDSKFNQFNGIVFMAHYSF